MSAHMQGTLLLRAWDVKDMPKDHIYSLRNDVSLVLPFAMPFLISLYTDMWMISGYGAATLVIPRDLLSLLHEHTLAIGGLFVHPAKSQSDIP